MWIMRFSHKSIVQSHDSWVRSCDLLLLISNIYQLINLHWFLYQGIQMPDANTRGSLGEWESLCKPEPQQRGFTQTFEFFQTHSRLQCAQSVSLWSFCGGGEMEGHILEKKLLLLLSKGCPGTSELMHTKTGNWYAHCKFGGCSNTEEIQ